MPKSSNSQPDLILPGKDKKTSVSINLPNLLPSWSPDCQNTSSNSNSFEFLVRAVVQDAAAGKKVILRSGPMPHYASLLSSCIGLINFSLNERNSFGTFFKFS